MTWLRVLYLANGAAFGTFSCYVAVILLQHGFDPSLVAFSSSLGSICFWLVLPAWGHIGDSGLGPRRAIQLAALPAGLLMLGLIPPLPVLVLVGVCLAVSCTNGPINALTDALAISGLTDPPREYPRLRMLGSLGAGIFALGSGVVYDRTGYVAAPVAGLASMLVIAFAAGRVARAPDRAGHERPTPGASGQSDAAHPEPARRHGRFGSVSEALAGRPRLIGLLAGCLGIFIGIMGGATFITLRLAALGGGPSTIGFANGVGTSAEVPGMLLAGWLATRVGVRPILAVASLGLVATYTSWAFVTEPQVIAVTKMFAGFFFAGVTVSFVITIASMLPVGLVSTGQTLYQSVAFGAAAILANAAGGVIYGVWGIQVVFLFLAAVALVGGIIAVAAAPAQIRVRLPATDPTH